MIELIRRKFEVRLPLAQAWEHLARVEDWPTWARHIKKVELQPPGELGPKSTGVIHLRGGMKSAFSMTEFEPPLRWLWIGPFLWMTVHYDHVFEELAPQRTRLTWIVAGEGFGVSILGRLFAMIYNRNLDRAVPSLIEQMNAAAE